jgi:hypothetical protein
MPAVAGLICIVLFYVLRSSIFLFLALIIFIAGSLSIGALSRSKPQGTQKKKKSQNSPKDSALTLFP